MDKIHRFEGPKSKKGLIMTNIVVAAYNPNDLSEIKELWNTIYSPEHTEKRANVFRHIAERNPRLSSGDLPTYFALKKDNKVIGLYGKMPFEFFYQQKTYVANFLHDGLISPEFRGYGLAKMVMKYIVDHSNHVIFALWMNKAQTALTAKSGYTHIKNCYSYKRIHDIRYLSSKIKVFSIPFIYYIANLLLRIWYWLRTESYYFDNYDFNRASSFPIKHEKDLEEICKKYLIIGKRDTGYLNWKYAFLPEKKYKIYLLLRKGRLAGYVVLRTERVSPNTRKGIIVDILSDLDDEGSFETLIKNSINYFNKEKVNYTLCLCTNPSHIKILKRYGFFRSMNSQPFMVNKWEETYDKDLLLNISNWHLTFGDNDGDVWDDL